MRIRKMQEEDVSCPHNKKDEEEGKRFFMFSSLHLI